MDGTVEGLWMWILPLLDMEREVICFCTMNYIIKSLLHMHDDMRVHCGYSPYSSMRGTAVLMDMGTDISGYS